MCICVQDRDEAKRQLTAHQKIIDKHKEMIQKCINFTKMLLVEKVPSDGCVLYHINLLSVWLKFQIEYHFSVVSKDVFLMSCNSCLRC